MCITLICWNCFANISYFHLHILPIYLLGAYLRLNQSEIFEKYLSKQEFQICKMVISLLSLILIGYLTIMWAAIAPVQMLLRYLSILPFVMLLSQIPAIDVKKTVSGYGMFIYCSHDIVFRLTWSVLKKFSFSMIANWALLVLIAEILITGSYLMMKKYYPRILGTFIGGR